jgi:acetate kinase
VIVLALNCGSSSLKFDTSMALTPLEGLVMSVDPALIGHLSRAEGVPAQEVERWLRSRQPCKS